MRSFSGVPLCAAVLAAVGLATAAQALTNDFSINPIGSPGVTVQGPDAANVNTRFTYNSIGGTLTGHYDTTAPTVKMLFDLGKHYTQDSSFAFTARIGLPGGTLNSPADFGGSVACFGLVNSASTGDSRASTGHFDASFNFIEDTPGTSYNLMTLDYFPTLDQSFGGNSLSLTTIAAPQAGVSFNSSFGFGYTLASLPLDQFFNVQVTYDAATHTAHLDYGSGTVNSNLTGKVFDMDSFGIALWNDPNLTAQAPAVPSGSPVIADVVFDSFSVTDTPEPGTIGLLGAGLLLLRRRRGSFRRA